MRGRDPCVQPHNLGGGFKNKSSHKHPIISVNALVGRKGGGGGGGVTAYDHKHSKKKGGKSVAQKIIPLLRQINTKTSAGNVEFAKSNKILK